MEDPTWFSYYFVYGLIAVLSVTISAITLLDIASFISPAAKTMIKGGKRRV